MEPAGGEEEDTEAPGEVGYGLLSRPIGGVSHDALLAAVIFAASRPWEMLENVDRDACSFEDRDDYAIRRVACHGSANPHVELVYFDEFFGAVTFNQCSRGEEPGDSDVVLSVCVPPQLHFAQCSRHSTSRQRSWCT